MKHHDLRPTFEPWIERLLNASDGSLRDRTLVEAAIVSSGFEAAALWRPFEATFENGGRKETWRCVVARGPDAALPGAFEIEAVARGEISGESLPGRVVVRAGEGRDRCLLALGGLAMFDDALDWIEGLLHTHAVITGAAERPIANLDRVASPLPASSRDEGGQADGAESHSDPKRRTTALDDEE